LNEKRQIPWLSAEKDEFRGIFRGSKIRGNLNSAARLEIPRPAENWALMMSDASLGLLIFWMLT